ncbi:hypothetical protein A3860_28645 [Niastella vici]|uniref:Uncharacterized protein n=1 Tax=Niastella vici TaxID=1703345 RepID=A0A1V9FVG2_9BACT|nr:hypothetical protein A3860_28645 [Niastella vici]
MALLKRTNNNRGLTPSKKINAPATESGGNSFLRDGFCFQRITGSVFKRTFGSYFGFQLDLDLVFLRTLDILDSLTQEYVTVFRTLGLWFFFRTWTSVFLLDFGLRTLVFLSDFGLRTLVFLGIRILVFLSDFGLLVFQLDVELGFSFGPGLFTLVFLSDVGYFNIFLFACIKIETLTTFYSSFHHLFVLLVGKLIRI